MIRYMQKNMVSMADHNVVFKNVCCSGLTFFSTIFQSNHDFVWLGQGVQSSILQCCLIVLSSPRHFARNHPNHIILTHYTDTRETSPSHTLKIRVPSGEQLVLLFDFGNSQLGIEPGNSRSRSGHSTYCASEAGDSQERNVPTKINNISTAVTSQFGHFGHFVPRWCTYKVI